VYVVWDGELSSAGALTIMLKAKGWLREINITAQIRSNGQLRTVNAAAVLGLAPASLATDIDDRKQGIV